MPTPAASRPASRSSGRNRPLPFAHRTPAGNAPRGFVFWRNPAPRNVVPWLEEHAPMIDCLGFLLGATLVGGAARDAGAERELVVLVHGLGRSHRSMRALERALA